VIAHRHKEDLGGYRPTFVTTAHNRSGIAVLTAYNTLLVTFRTKPEGTIVQVAQRGRDCSKKPTWDEAVDAQPDLCCPSLPVAGVNDCPALIVSRVVKDDLLTVHWGGAIANHKVLEDQPAQVISRAFFAERTKHTKTGVHQVVSSVQPVQL
jgi:hypothetical protein